MTRPAPKKDQGLGIRPLSSKEHERRMSIARRVAEWRLGSAGWADEIVGAYMNPDAAVAQLDFEQGEEATR